MRGAYDFVRFVPTILVCACAYVPCGVLMAVVATAQVCIFYLVLRALDTVGQ
jgi:hypothetical protein